MFLFFNDTATTEIYTLSLHDALPISDAAVAGGAGGAVCRRRAGTGAVGAAAAVLRAGAPGEWPARRSLRQRRPLRSEEHTSELQSRQYLVCRLLLEKKKTSSDFSQLT